jgi:WD40 repeat protein
MNRKPLYLIVLPLVSLILKACGPFQTELDNQITMTAVSRTATFKQSFAEIETVSPTLTLTITSTPIVSPTLRLEPTDVPTETVVPPSRELYGPYFDFAYSPDGNYLAVKINNTSTAPLVSTIDIYKVGGELLWSIPIDEMYLYDPSPFGKIDRWSQNSRFLYFYESFGYDGAPTLWDGYNPSLIDVRNGRVARFVRSDDLIAYAVSPNDKLLAYIRAEDEPRVLVVRDLVTGNERRATIEIETEEYSQAGWISWSPDSSVLVFHTLGDAYVAEAIHVDLETMHLTAFAHFWPEGYHLEGWLDAETIRYYSAYDEAGIVIDVSVGALEAIVEITPFPMILPEY